MFESIYNAENKGHGERIRKRKRHDTLVGFDTVPGHSARRPMENRRSGDLSAAAGRTRDGGGGHSRVSFTQVLTASGTSGSGTSTASCRPSFCRVMR